MKRIVLDIDSDVPVEELIDYVRKKLNLDITSVAAMENKCYYYPVIRKVYKDRSVITIK